MPYLALYLKRTPMCTYYPIDNRETQTTTTPSLRPSSITSVEALKDMWKILRSDSGACVPYTDTPPIPFDFNMYGNFPTRIRVRKCIIEEIHDALNKSRSITLYNNRL